MKADYVHKDTLTATDYVELNKNNELLMSYNQELLKENQSLKKQLEEINKMIEKYGFVNIEQVMLSYCGLIAQQEEFINYMMNTIENITHDETDDEEIKGYLIQRGNTFKEILSKYKSIIGGKREIRSWNVCKAGK